MPDIPTPTHIHLHKQRRVLELRFEDGAAFDLSCEYLRVYSPAAEVKVARSQGRWPAVRENVNIEAIDPMGSYAVRLTFNDGHDTGIYSWQTLYQLGQDYPQNWAAYLQALEQGGIHRAVNPPPAGCIRLLYFADLAAVLLLEQEESPLPENVTDLTSLVAWLRTRGQLWEEALAKPLTMTINKEFTRPDSPVQVGDEVAIVPAGQEAALVRH